MTDSLNNDSNGQFYGDNAIVGSPSDDDSSSNQITNVTGQQITIGTPDGKSVLEDKGADNNGSNAIDGKDGKDSDDSSNGDTSAPDNPDGSTLPSLDSQMKTNTDAMATIGKDLVSKGVDLATAIEEYEENGTLSEETFKAIEKAGYPREVVAGIIEARKALDDAYTRNVYDYVGGEQEYRNMATWMRGNLSKGDIEAFNNAVDEGNITVVKLMIDGIRAKQVAKQGTRNPTILGGTTRSSQSNQGFANKQEMVNAMSDKRYGVDREYTLNVERKMMFSNIF